MKKVSLIVCGVNAPEVARLKKEWGMSDGLSVSVVDAREYDRFSSCQAWPFFCTKSRFGLNDEDAINKAEDYVITKAVNFATSFGMADPAVYIFVEDPLVPEFLVKLLRKVKPLKKAGYRLEVKASKPLRLINAKNGLSAVLVDSFYGYYSQDMVAYRYALTCETEALADKLSYQINMFYHGVLLPSQIPPLD